MLVGLGVGALGVIAASMPASAHGRAPGTGVAIEGSVGALVVIGLPVLSGLAVGSAVVRYRRPTGLGGPAWSVVVGLVLAGLGVVSLLSATTGAPWRSLAGGLLGVVFARAVSEGTAASESGCGNHADLALGAVCTHRVFEGLVVSTLYATGGAVGVVSAVAIAGHSALETAAIGGLYAVDSHRTRAVGAILAVQAAYLVGGGTAIVVAGAVPVWVRPLLLAVVGGALVTVGAHETSRSVGRRGSAVSG